MPILSSALRRGVQSELVHFNKSGSANQKIAGLPFLWQAQRKVTLAMKTYETNDVTTQPPF